MLAQLLVSGVAQGALYALVALAMTVIYRATTVINFGHGDIVMAGAFVVYLLVVLGGAPFLISALLAVVLLFAFGVAVCKGLIRPIMAGPHLALAMMAVAVGYALRGLARVLWGREVLPFPKVLPQGSFTVGPVILAPSDLIVTGTVVGTVAILAFVFYVTSLGKTAQAVFQSERGAALVGINVSAFQSTMWGIGAAMAALGGILIAPVTLLYPDLARVDSHPRLRRDDARRLRVVPGSSRRTFQFDTPGKVTGHPIVRNDVVVMRSSGGGGYGDPLERDPHRVAEDVTRQVVSIEAARDWYGVVLGSDGEPDGEATNALRAELRAARVYVRVVVDETLDPYYGLKGRHRTLELTTADADRLKVRAESLIELFGRNPAPLRAWVRLGDIAAGAVRMDAFGCKVLGVGTDDQILLRRVDTPIVPKGLAGSIGRLVD